MYYDPQTIELLVRTLALAWQSLSPEQRARTNRLAMAQQMLRAAAKGERDPIRLRASAILQVVSPEPPLLPDGAPLQWTQKLSWSL
jgi:hypothetical protein